MRERVDNIRPPTYLVHPTPHSSGATVSDELVFQTAAELSTSIRSKEVSAVEVIEAHLRQIERTNPIVNAICTLTAEQAIAQATHLDSVLASGGSPGPLHGLPVGIKDLSATKGIRTTKGSPIYSDWVPDYDDLIVERLKAAGAVIIGKTNTPEFGAGSQTFNPVFGPTLNPYDTTKTCGGSSGGAAAALACGMMPIATGSDLGGSLRNPAAWNNVVGFRTSTGRVPAYPAPLAFNSLSVQGPMARTVRDVALQLSVMAGPDPRVPTSLAEPGGMFNEKLDRSFKGVKVAWSRDLGGFPVESSIIDVLEKQLSVFEDLGCDVVEASPDLSDADEIFMAFRAYKYALDHERHLREHRDLMKQTVIWNTEAGLKLSALELARAEEKKTRLHEHMTGFMGEFDYLLSPVTSVWPFSIDREYVTEINGVELENYIQWMATCYAITVTGLPAISVPAGFSDAGLPVGLQITGRFRDDFAVLQLADAFEGATRFHGVRPKLAELDTGGA
jgi:amidase